MSWTIRTSDGLRNVHRRTVVDIDRAWDLVMAGIHRPDAGVWPGDSWPPLILDAGLTVGSAGGHGPIRYSVSDVDDSRVRFTFAPGFVDGFHEISRSDQDIVHTLELRHPSAFVTRWVPPARRCDRGSVRQHRRQTC